MTINQIPQYNADNDESLTVNSVAHGGQLASANDAPGDYCSLFFFALCQNQYG
jgi:hypothetical protein